VRAVTDDALYVADEDHGVVRRVALPLDTSAPAILDVPMPGPPAQVLALDGRVLVTVRDPGLLLIMRPDPQKGLVETARVELPADAWGVAVTPDEKTALVTSAWTHQVSAIDIETGKKRWSIDVAREPRAVVVRPDGASAYVTHLTGSSITRIDDIGGSPVAKAVALPPDPVRAPSGKTLNASLAYSAALSDDGTRLYVPRHALGAIGKTAWQEPWFGTSTVDVLVTATDKPIIGKRVPGLPKARTTELEERQGARGDLSVSAAEFTPFLQPRAIAYRKTAKTLLVAGEGDDTVAELNAQSVSPALQWLRSYKVGSKYDKFIRVAGAGGAPSGIALSADERTAYVFCRSTYDIAVVALADPSAPPYNKKDEAKVPPTPTAHLAEDPHPNDIAMGRRLFYNATDELTSGGLACAGCHPEGRDDGHIWHEAEFGDHMVFFGEPENTPASEQKDIRGYPRQTPMLAGRVNAKGPYGWHAQNADLYERLKEGFGLHRWALDNREGADNEIRARAGFLMAFLRKGLATPPKEARDLTEIEQKGKQIFLSERTQCAKCHVPESDYTDREKYAFKRKKPPQGYDDEAKNEFKTPSLKFVAGTPPYFHDGSAATLDQLIEQNNDWMGKTNHLSKEEQAALVAFLKTL
jgi:DNA-binding beta-propeller fold protein YncE/mono/diheme cytochrome c family protein